MPNLGAILKSEIARLARREQRVQFEGLKKAATHQRKAIAALRRQVEGLERQLRLVAAGARRQARDAAGAAALEGASRRFSAKGFRSWRARMKLSAEQVARLIGCSAQSVYNWETKKARPRPAQLQAIADLRGMGKRLLMARLEELASSADAAGAAGASARRSKRGRRKGAPASTGAQRGRRRARRSPAAAAEPAPAA